MRPRSWPVRSAFAFAVVLLAVPIVSADTLFAPTSSSVVPAQLLNGPPPATEVALGEDPAGTIRSIPLGAWATPRTAAGSGERNGIHFDCPDKAEPRTDDDQVIVVYGCPLLVADEGDLFSNIQLAVSPKDPRHVALISLHGGSTAKGPHPYSRTGQTHTTFVSDDEGISWADNPIPGQNGLGASSSGVMDKDGRIYIAYLWTDNRSGSDIRLYKAPSAERPADIDQSYRDPFQIDVRDPGNTIRDIGLVRLRGKAPIVVRESANESAPPPDRPVGADDSPSTGERIYAVWHEKAFDPAGSKTEMTGWIDHAWTDTTADNYWDRGPADQVIGPCQDASNPVSWDNKIYVACVVARGYKARDRAYVGDIDLWSIDPKTGKGSLVDHTEIQGEAPVLAVNRFGYFVLGAHEMHSEHSISAVVTFSQEGHGWSSFGDVGGDLHRFAGARPALDARLTAISVSEDDRTAVFIYKERHNLSAEGGDDPSADPAGQAEEPQPYSRIMVALNECEVLGAAIFQLGTGEQLLAGYTDTLTDFQPPPAAAFDDIKDGLTYVRWPGGLERMHFAVNDQGAALYGRIVLEKTASSCPLPPAFPNIPQAALPQAISFSSTAQTVVGAGTGILSAAMIGYLLTVKRRHASFVAAEAK